MEKTSSQPQSFKYVTDFQHFLKQKCDIDLNNDDVFSSFREMYKAVIRFEA